MSTPTEKLVAAGVSIWLDDLSRERITSGNLTELISTRNVSGVTTNPTIFQGAIGGGGHSYAAQIAELAAAGASVDDAIFAATTDDVRDRPRSSDGYRSTGHCRAVSQHARRRDG